MVSFRPAIPGQNSTGVDSTDEELFRNRTDHISYADLQQRPIDVSLCVVQPAGLRWEVRRNWYNGRLAARAAFCIGRAEYDLSVTDPDWRSRILPLGEGSHDRHAPGIDDHEEVFFAVSLAGVLEDTGQCYKLVAGIVVLAG